MNTTTQQRVMHIAHANWQNDSWSNRLKQAWMMADIRKYMRHGIVKFVFMKQNGELRNARGTLWDEIIPDDKKPTGIRQQRIHEGLEQANYTSISFFDLDKQEWRAFKVESLVTVNDVLIASRKYV